MRCLSLPLLLAAPLAYLLACALASAVLSYPLHCLLPRSLDYQTLVFKLAQFLMIFGLFPLGRWLGMGWADVGLALPRGLLFQQLRRGFCYGALMLGLHVALLLGLGVRVFIPEKMQWARFVSLSLKGIPIGLGVALLEEPMFRGFLLGSLLRKTGRVNAVLVSAAYFAGLHFLSTDMRPSHDEVGWGTAFVIMADAFHDLPANLYWDSFLALFAAGAFLACVRLLAPASGLGYCLGVHAGWVFVLKATNPLSRLDFFSPWVRFVSPFDGTIGSFSAAWTGVLIALLAARLYWRPPA